MIPRRQRFLILTGAGASVFVLAVAGILWMRRGEPETYRPGEALEGLTNTLSRSLPEDHPTVSFSDVSEAAGIRFRHFPGQRTTRLPEDMGSGAAWGDYDRDGWIDLFVMNQSGPLTLSADEVAASSAHACLYHNRGDGTFEEVSEAAGVAFRGTGMGVAWGDYDGDGWPDLLLTSYGELVLYRNLGDGSFQDVTRRAGLAGFEGFWTGVSWADYDRDGDLDAYVGGYVRFEDRPGAGPSRQYDIEQPTSLNPSAFSPEANLLLRNDGSGSFTDAAAEAGVQDERGRSLSVAWTDLDEDGWPDLYVANDLSDNALYRNLGNGKFEETSHMAAVADYRGAMGLAVGDWDGDGDQDLFITHWIAQENALYDSDFRRRAGEPPRPDALLRFMDDADRQGLGQIGLDFVGWGTSFFDYDNDGRLDLLVVNGSTIQEQDDPTRLVPMRDLLFWNGGRERGFFDVSAVSGAYFSRELVGRGAAFGDYDNDGDVDVFIVNHQGPGVLLRNDASDENAWLELELEGKESNRSAIGARVRVVAGGLSQIAEVGAQPSYLSQSAPVLHFGLGVAERVDTVVIRWPSGKTQVLAEQLPVRTQLRLREGEEAEQVPIAMAAPGVQGDDRSRVQEFWNHYRNATQDRVAGREPEAAAEYRRALALDPDHQDVLYYLGSVLFDLDSIAEARKALEHLVAVNPRSARAYSRLGVVRLCSSERGTERFAAAESAFRAASSVNRNETGPYLRLAEVHLVREERSEARRALQTILGSNPRSASAHLLLGYLAWIEGRKDQALDFLRTALEAAAEAPTGAAPREGDGGKRAPESVTRSVACAGFLSLESFLSPTADGPEGVDVAAMERLYTDLQGRLDELANAGG